MGALCPLCGARTTWRVFPTRRDLNHKIPMDCHACRKEEATHWQQWEDGIDVTQFGGGPMRHPHPTNEQVPPFMRPIADKS